MTDALMVTKKYLKSLSRPRLAKWISQNGDRLVGGGVFTIGNTPIVPIIRKLSEKYSKTDFIPSHVGSIIKVSGLYYIFNMTPPRSSMIELMDYILKTDEEFRIIYRGKNFNLDVEMFSNYILTKLGKKYGYFSALQSASIFRKLLLNTSEHCSEIHCLGLQKQGYFKDVKADDMLPVEVYQQMFKGDF